jgi:D-alanine-D-alanine ligase
MQDALKGNFADTAQMKYMVFPFAEGGRGSGRRALIPAFCSFLNIAFCGSPAHASSIARHKFHANAVLKNAGIRTPDTWMYFGKGQWAGERVPNRSTKVIVKPAYESNSIGVDADSSFVVEDGLQERLDSYVGRIKQAAVVQEFVSGYEIASPIVEIEGRIIALPCVGFETPRGRKMIGINRTFQDECIDNNVSYYKVEEIDSRYIESFQRASARAFSALEMSIMGRMDSRIDEDGRAWIFDTNESPPPLSTTSYAMSFGLLGLTYVDMVAAWLGATCHKFELT